MVQTALLVHNLNFGTRFGLHTTVTQYTKDYEDDETIFRLCYFSTTFNVVLY
jgi:hypothetical protein